MNYFNYFTEIEDTFVRRRGRNLLLSPLDWALIEGWQQRGIPLHIVIRALESVFDTFDKNPGKRTIKGLFYCREEVEAQFEEWLTSQVGKASEHPASEDGGITREDIEKHISDAIDSLRKPPTPELAEDFARAVERLELLLADMGQNHQLVDESLADIERFLEHSLLERAAADELAELETEVAAALKPYKRTIEKDIYESTFRMMLLRRLRENAGVPRLGLFYL